MNAPALILACSASPESPAMVSGLGEQALRDNKYIKAMSRSNANTWVCIVITDGMFTNARSGGSSVRDLAISVECLALSTAQKELL